GTQVDWTGFYANERRRRVVLPTYPFAKIKIWPKPEAQPVIAPAAASTAPAAVPQTVEAPSPAVTVPSPQAPTISRRENIVAIMQSMVEELSGTKISDFNESMSFLELGLDSLLLTQAATLFQRKFGVSISFRQLMEDLCAVCSLADYLDANLPPGAFAPQPAPSTVPVASSSAMPALALPSGGGTPLEQLILQQLQATQQL